jgi:Protein of unknown function (DUF1634)
MNHATPRPVQLEWLLAGTLHLGTWLASAAIGLGLALALLDSRFSAPKLAILRDVRVATVGIALLILLPVVRVIVMLIVYLRQRDYLFSVIALLVLTIILLGFAVGLSGRHSDTPTSPVQVRGETAPPQAMQAILRKSNSFLTAMPHTFYRQKFFSRQS